MNLLKLSTICYPTCPGPAAVRKPILLLTVGLPRSGKSTWARKQDAPIVCRDSIRESLTGDRRNFGEEKEVSRIEEIMVKALLLSGHEKVIVDATHLRIKYRHRWEKFAKDNDYKVVYKTFDTSMKECQKRARKSYPKEIRFPYVIKSMWENRQLWFPIPEGKKDIWEKFNKYRKWFDKGNRKQCL